MNNDNTKKKSFLHIKKNIHKSVNRSSNLQVNEQTITSIRKYYKPEMKKRNVENSTFKGKDIHEMTNSTKALLAHKNKSKKDNNETDDNTQKGSLKSKYKKKAPFNYEKYYERVKKWKEKRCGIQYDKTNEDNQINRKENKQEIIKIIEENKKEAIYEDLMSEKERNVKKLQRSKTHKLLLDTKKETNVSKKNEHTTCKETKKEEEIIHVKKNGVTFAEDTKDSERNKLTLACSTKKNPIESQSIHMKHQNKKKSTLSQLLTKSTDCILCDHKKKKSSHKTIGDSTENLELLKTYSKSSYASQQSSTTMNHEPFSYSNNMQIMNEPSSSNIFQKNNMHESGTNSRSTITVHDTTRKRNFEHVNHSLLLSTRSKEHEDSMNEKETSEEKSSVELEKPNKQRKRTNKGKEHEPIQLKNLQRGNKYEDNTHVYTERISKKVEHSSEYSFDHTFEKEDVYEDEEKDITYNDNSIDNDSEHNSVNYRESRKNEKGKEPDDDNDDNTLFESPLEGKTRIAKNYMAYDCTPLYHFKSNEENKPRQRTLDTFTDHPKSEPDFHFYDAHDSFEFDLEKHPTLYQRNTHKKLIDQNEKQIKNNFDVFLCLFMKYERRDSQILCLLMDEEITSCSAFFQKGVKPLLDEYKEAKLKKMKERTENKKDSSSEQIPYIRITKFVLEIMITIIRKEYYMYINKLYEQRKNDAILYISDDLEHEFKEINKRLKNWKTQTYETFLNKMRDKPMCHYEKKIKLIQKPKWSEPQNLKRLLKKQQNYNPFTIFGTSIKEIDLEEIFTLEVYNMYVTNEDRMKNIVLYELYVKNIIKSLYTKIEESEWKEVVPVLQDHWKYFATLECNMLMDPLLLEEILWYIEINNMYTDKSNDTFFYETCFCPTPNPRNQNNLNDIKNWNTLITQKYRCKEDNTLCTHRPVALKNSYQNQNLVFTYEEQNIEQKSTQSNNKFIFFIPRPSSALCYDSDFFKWKRKNLMRQKYKDFTEHVQKNKTSITEDPYIQKNKSQEWISQNFFDNFFFNYYTYNFNNHICKFNSII